MRCLKYEMDMIFEWQALKDRVTGIVWKDDDVTGIVWKDDVVTLFDMCLFKLKNEMFANF